MHRIVVSRVLRGLAFLFLAAAYPLIGWFCSLLGCGLTVGDLWVPDSPALLLLAVLLPALFAPMGISELAAGLLGSRQETSVDLLGGRGTRVYPPIERITFEARETFALALEEAMRRRHHRIGSLHILLGLLGQENTKALRVLRSLGVGVDRLRTEIEAIVEPGGLPGWLDDLHVTPQAREALRRAEEAAERLGSNLAGTEHILIGLLEAADGSFRRALEALRLTSEKVEVQILKRRGDPNR